MSRNKEKMVKALKKRGFTDLTAPFQLFYWARDGWYLHCDQCKHAWVGQNWTHVISATNKGKNDQYLSDRRDFKILLEERAEQEGYKLISNERV